MALHVEMMDENYLNADILGIALADENRTIYLPFSVAKSSDLFKTWLQDETKKKYCSDSKAALASLARYGIEIKGIEFDLLLGCIHSESIYFLYGYCFNCKTVWLYRC